MKDRFKFRAWGADGREWSLYLGSLANIDDFICIEQCSGRTDCHGNLIYEGDKLAEIDGAYVGEVFFDNNYSYFGVVNSGDVIGFYDLCFGEIEIIGNIHSNPNTLGGK